MSDKPKQECITHIDKKCHAILSRERKRKKMAASSSRSPLARAGLLPKKQRTPQSGNSYEWF